jgi:hypothetical protein
VIESLHHTRKEIQIKFHVTNSTEAEMEEKHEEVERKRKIDKKSSMSFLTKNQSENFPR